MYRILEDPTHHYQNVEGDSLALFLILGIVIGLFSATMKIDPYNNVHIYNISMSHEEDVFS